MSAKKLRRDILRKLDAWNEYSLFRLAGIKNLSRADMDTLLMCCDWYERNGNLGGLAYFGPEIRSVLTKYGLLEEKCL